MAQGNVPYLNSRISLVTKSGIRYEGTLYSVDPKESTFALANGLRQLVRSFGSEDRYTESPVPPSNEVYEYVIFKGSDIQDLTVMDRPQSTPSAPSPAAPQGGPGAPAQQGRPQGQMPQQFNQPGYGMPPGYGIMGGFGQGYPPYGFPGAGGYPQGPGGFPPGAGGYPPWGMWGPYGQPGYGRGMAPPSNASRGPVPPGMSPQPGQQQQSQPAPATPGTAETLAQPPQQQAAREEEHPAKAEDAPSLGSAASAIGFDVKDKVAEVARKTPKTPSKSERGEQLAYDFAAEQHKKNEAARNNSQRQKRDETPKEKPQARAPANNDGGVASVNKNKGQSWAQRLAGSTGDAGATSAAREVSSPQSTQQRQRNDGARPQQQGDRPRGGNTRGRGGRGGSGRGGRGGSQQHHGGITATQLREQVKEEFDVEESNKAFNKASLLAEIEAERAKLRQERGVEPAAAYDPSVSIFDTISSEVFDRPEDAQKRREEHHRERDLNKETFGEAPSFHYGRGGRGGRGRGGGQQFARNNNRGPNNDANTRGRQRPQQPQRQPRVRN